MHDQPAVTPARRARARCLVAPLLWILAAGLLLVAPAAAVAADRSVAVEVSWTRVGVVEPFAPPAALRVGDEVTLHVATTGFESLPGASCYLTFSRGDAGDYPLLRAYVPGLDEPPPCHDWTFIVPPTSTGLHTLSAWVPVSELEQYSIVVPLSVEAGGVARPMTSNVPLLTWDLPTIFGDDRIRFGEVWTMPMPVNAERGCQFTLNGSYHTSMTVYGRDDGCDPWTVTVPDIRPPAYRTGEPNGYPWQVRFHGTWSRDDDTWRASGETVSGELLVDDATGPVTFASDRPAAVFAADDNPYWAYAGTVLRTPRVVGITTGTCRYEVKDVGGDHAIARPPTPLVDGSCPPVTLDATETGVFQVFLSIHDSADRRVASASTGGEIVDPLPPPVIDVPPIVESGEPVEIDASTQSGTPLDYEIVPELQTTASAAVAAVAAAAPVCSGASGTFVLDDLDRSATATCTFQVPGSYRITARFTDAAGTERSTSKTIRVSGDTVRPTVGAVLQRLVPGAQIGATIPVQLTWTASDDATGVRHARVDQQRRRGAWSIVDDHVATSAITRNLSRGQDYRFRVRVVDGASNTSRFVNSATFGPTTYSEADPDVRYTGPWSKTSSAGADGGAMRGTTKAGASATITFRGRSVAWVSPLSPIRGRAKIYLDGKYKTTVDLYRSTLSQRRIAFAWNWTSSATHTLRIVNEATPGHSRIDVDTIVVLD